MRCRLALVVAVGAMSACTNQPAAAPPDRELVRVAEQVCTVMWNWQLHMGAIMNDMSSATRFEADPSARTERYRTAFDQARSLNRELADQIAELPSGPYVDRLREDVGNGLFAADRIIEEIDTELDALHGSGVTGYHQVVPRIFLTFEKVIDVAKPEMADYGNEELTRAFISVAQCQHGVKDANDGRPRYVPTS